MTELMQYEEPRAALVTMQDQAVHRLAEWAQSADAAYRVAQRLVESSFVPQGFRGKPVEATAAILAGVEVGLSPMSALRAFDVIQGQATPRAITLRAIAQSYGHEIVVLESTATRCRVKCRRKGGEWQPVTWTLDRARDLGLTSRDAWKKQPIAMLLARATSEAARLVAADAILGIGAYSTEEIADGGAYEQTVADTTAAPAPTGTRRMSRRTSTGGSRPSANDAAGPLAGAESGEVSRFDPGPAPALEPDDDALAEFDPARTSNPAPSDEPLTPAQSKLIHTLFGKLGITDRDERLAEIGAVIGRDVDSSNDLTKAEATRLADRLRDRIGPGPDLFEEPSS